MAAAEERSRLRAEGNEHFRASSYRDALALYDAALAVDGSDEGTEVVHANRSAALHALGELELALAAGLEAVALDPSYAKGHLRVANGEPHCVACARVRSATLVFLRQRCSPRCEHAPLSALRRRSAAYEGLEQWPEAIEACAEVARLDPSQSAPMERRQEQLHRRLDPACWRLSRFSDVVESHTQGQTLESKPFHMQGHKWRFTLNPCGKSSHPDGVSLYLRYAGGGSVTATYTLAVELTNGERLGTHTCSKRFERDTTWGSLNIIDRDIALERSAADDTLIVRLCELHIIDTKATASAGARPKLLRCPRCSSQHDGSRWLTITALACVLYRWGRCAVAHTALLTLG